MKIKKDINSKMDVLKNFNSSNNLSSIDNYITYIDSIVSKLVKENKSLKKENKALKLYCKYLQYEKGISGKKDLGVDTIKNDFDTKKRQKTSKYKLKDRLKQELEYIKSKKSVKTEDLMHHFNISRATSQRDLKYLKKHSYIKYEGSKKTGYYTIVNEKTDIIK